MKTMDDYIDMLDEMLNGRRRRVPIVWSHRAPKLAPEQFEEVTEDQDTEVRAMFRERDPS